MLLFSYRLELRVKLMFNKKELRKPKNLIRDIALPFGWIISIASVFGEARNPWVIAAILTIITSITFFFGLANASLVEEGGEPNDSKLRNKFLLDMLLFFILALVIAVCFVAADKSATENHKVVVTFCILFSSYFSVTVASIASWRARVKRENM